MRAMLRETLFVVFATWATVATAHVAFHEEASALFNSGFRTGLRYSDNVSEDANLKVPELIKKYRYPSEVHTVTTPDGYILEMHRIPYGRDKNNVANTNKTAVFVMHGLLCSSAAWVISGPGSGLAYLLAEEGYDVWMGNARGTTYSRGHTTLNPDVDVQYWDFSWDEIGHIDLPSMIDYVLQQTGKKKIHYIGHSQGTTAFFVMASLRPEYNNKIILMQALAPVAYLANNSNPLLVAIAPYSTDIELLSTMVGVGELMAHNQILSWAGEALCRDQVVTQSICSNILFLIGGWDEAQNNVTIMPIIAGHMPAGCSVKQLAHYGQGISGKHFRRYDYGSLLANMEVYGTALPPDYVLSKVTAPVYLHYGNNDPLADVADVQILFKKLGNLIGKFLVPYPAFTHIDFMWAIDVKELLYDRVFNLIATAN